ncbi:hypothetical protein TU87_21135 [Pseudomonas weihenstephanensis]|nr:hypothetical protein TU87_21135 [Pseudomonas weihenstephanensis]
MNTLLFTMFAPLGLAFDPCDVEHVDPLRGEFRSIILAISIPFWPLLPFSEPRDPARLWITDHACGE